MVFLTEPESRGRIVSRLRILLTALILAAMPFFLSGCLLVYLVKSGYNQLKILNDRVPIKKVLAEKNLPAKERHKLELALEARDFAVHHLHLHATKNYTTFVDLHRPYVSWIVTVAYKDKLKQHYFWYPIVGHLPYKGFFNPKEAKAEAKRYAKKGYDVMVGGVTAYSTLGWFEDPILSTMLNEPDYDLVNTIIHESTHATIFIKSQAGFNERLAVFVGDLGTKLFYKYKEGPHSKTLREIRRENADDILFSKFISKEIARMKNWYKSHPHPTEAQRQIQFQKIKTDFVKSVKPKLLTDTYVNFTHTKLNNAVLLYFGTYNYNLSDFAKLYKKLGDNFDRFIQVCKTFENSRNPTADLKKMIANGVPNVKPSAPHQ